MPTSIIDVWQSDSLIPDNTTYTITFPLDAGRYRHVCRLHLPSSTAVRSYGALARRVLSGMLGTATGNPVWRLSPQGADVRAGDDDGAAGRRADLDSPIRRVGATGASSAYAALQPLPRRSLQKSLSRDLHLPEPVPRVKFIGPSANRRGFQGSERRRSALPRISTWGALAASELATKRNSPVVTLLQQDRPCGQAYSFRRR